MSSGPAKRIGRPLERRDTRLRRRIRRRTIYMIVFAALLGSGIAIALFFVG